MATSLVDGDLNVRGTLYASSMQIPAGTIDNADVASNAAIAASKVVRHQSVDVELAEAATAITAVTRLLHVFRATGTIKGIEAAIVVQATGADRTVTLDLKKSTGGGAFASVLSATFGFTNSSTILVPVAGVISSAGCVDGDILEIVVTVAGASGNQAKGLIVTLTYEEEWAA